MRAWALTSVALLLLAAGGCGDDTGETAETGPVRTVEDADLSGIDFEDLTGHDEVAVGARDNVFVPDYIEISPGTTVVFTNRGRDDHNVLPVTDGAFPPIEREDLRPGDVASLTFDEPGEYPYYCSLHGTTTRGMVGAVRVVDSP